MRINEQGKTRWTQTQGRTMKKAVMLPRKRGGGQQGPDRLHYKAGGRKGGGSCILYADYTSATVKGELWPELEVKLLRMLDPLFREMKLNRLKVNEDKTGLLLMGHAPAHPPFKAPAKILKLTKLRKFYNL